MRGIHIDHNIKKVLLKFLTYGTLVAIMIFTLVPFAWLLVSSLKDQTTLFRGNPTWMIEKVSISGYRWIINKDIGGNILIPLENSLVVSILSSITTMCFAVSAGYAVGRYRFPGISVFLIILFLAQILQGPIIMIPWYRIASFLRLIDTRLILIIVYGTITIPISTIMMSGFFKTIPKELEEAAYIDGCTKLGTLFRIVLPITTPGIVATSILSFIYAWNDYQYALILTSSLRSKTVQVLINDLIQAMGAINWPGLLAGGVIVTLPVVILFALIQKYIVDGLTSGAVKG